MKQVANSKDVLSRAASVYEELVGVVQGNFVGGLDAEGFVLRGEATPAEGGKLAIRVVGHRSLNDPQWHSWVIGALLRAGALQDVAQKIWNAGIFLQDLTSYGSIGRAMKPYAIGMVMALDELWLRAENLGLHPEVCLGFQKRIADKTFGVIDLVQMLKDADPITGKGVAQTGGDALYRQANITGYGVR